jgi:hypothetical protein
VLKLADKPTGLVGGGNGIKSSLFGDLTAPWRFDPSLYSKMTRQFGKIRRTKPRKSAQRLETLNIVR